MLSDNFILELEKEIDSGKMSHAYLLFGGVGNSALEAGQYIFQYLKKNENAFSGDFREYLDDGEEIKKENVLEIIRLANQSSQGIGNFFLIENVERMNVTSFNVFLKTLEEPPGETTFVLTTKFLDLIPETIKSRCRLVKIPYTSLSEIEEAIMVKTPFADNVLVKDLVAFYNGSESKILAILEDEEKMAVFRKLKDFANSLLEKGDLADRIKFLQEVKADGQTMQLLDILIFVLRNELVLSTSGKGVSSFSPEKLAELVDATLDAKSSIAKNINEALVMDNLILLIDF